jgi:hypothetical protein
MIVIGVLTLLGYILAGLLRGWRVAHLDEIDGGLYYAAFWDLVFMAIAVYLIWKVAPSSNWVQRAQLLLVGVCGAVVGAALGIFFFPLSNHEKDLFSDLGKWVSGLFAGAVGTQFLDSLKFLTQTDQGKPPKIFQRLYAIAAGLFVASLGLAIITEYSARFWGEDVSITAPNQSGLTRNSDGSYTIDTGPVENIRLPDLLVFLITSRFVGVLKGLMTLRLTGEK